MIRLPPAQGRYDAAMTQHSNKASFAVGEMHEPEVERFVTALDRQGQMDVIQELRRWVRERLNLRSGSTVFDVGCGTGEELLQLAHLVGGGGHAVGFDANDPMLSIARERTGSVPGVEIEKGEASDLPADDGAADALVCERVLQHLPYSPVLAVKEFSRVVREGGRIALTDTDWSSLQILVTDDDSASEKLQSIRARIPLPFTSNQEAGKHLLDYCTQAGLTVLDSRSLILGDFAPTLVLGVRSGLTAAAESVLSSTELAAADDLLDGALRRGTLRIAVRFHSIVASRVTTS